MCVRLLPEASRRVMTSLTSPKGTASLSHRSPVVVAGMFMYDDLYS